MAKPKSIAPENAKPILSQAVCGKLQKSLLAWYRLGHRDLPWRNTRDPYEVWVSEIMLQQTQVETVLPYYDRFLKAFPTIQDLASASSDAVIKLWEGLGYYARARNLHRAAKAIVDDHGGVFPTAFEDIHALPGIGQSTAGAISTFALGKPHPILDGNVKRVLARVGAVENPIEDKAVLETLWVLSSALLPTHSDDAYDMNQALMELGATCCTPKSPQCAACPWQSECRAKAMQRQAELPVRIKKKPTPHYTIGVGVVFNKKGEVLIALRQEEGLLGGLWEFPGGKCLDDESLAACVKREVKEETTIHVEVETHLVTVKHAYSHFRITLHAYRCRYKSGSAKARASQEVRWVKPEELSQYAFPKANHPILKFIQPVSDCESNALRVEQGVLF